jgi:hypothetical protein
MKNFANAAGNCSFWTPLEIELLEAYEPASGVEAVLKSQAIERVEELKVYANMYSHVKLFEGMNIKIAGIPASSSDWRHAGLKLYVGCLEDFLQV